MIFLGFKLFKRDLTSPVKIMIAAGLLFLLIKPAAAQEPDSSFNNGYYRSRLELFRKSPDRKNEVIFLGNSITEAGSWQKLIPGKTVINRGISGDNSFGVYARLEEALSSKPDKIFLLIGINDLKRGTALKYILHNYERIIEKVSSVCPHTILYLQSVLPVAETMLASFYSKITNERIRQLNDRLLEIAVKYKVHFIDLNKEVFADEKGQMKQHLTTDGLHLQPQAYLLWIDYLCKNKYL